VKGVKSQPSADGWARFPSSEQTSKRDFFLYPWVQPDRVNFQIAIDLQVQLLDAVLAEHKALAKKRKLGYGRSTFVADINRVMVACVVAPLAYGT
jgi:hypothetical protein